MIGLGTIINTVAIIIGGIIGLVLKNAFSEKMQYTITKAIGVCVLFIGISGAMTEMLSVQNTNLVSSGTLMMILSFVLGSLIGEWIDIEAQIEQFGKWLKKKTHSENDANFLNAFLTTSFTVCIGAMAIVGAIEDGISGDYSLLLAKSVLDFTMVAVMTSSLGKGSIFSAIPVAVLQGTVTIFARFIQPIMTPQATSNLSLTGSVLIFCVGLNLIWPGKVKVANMLPSIIFAVIFAFII